LPAVVVVVVIIVFVGIVVAAGQVGQVVGQQMRQPLPQMRRSFMGSRIRAGVAAQSPGILKSI